MPEYNPQPSVLHVGRKEKNEKETLVLGDGRILEGEAIEEKINELKNRSFLCTGMAGAQKSTLLASLNGQDDTLVFAYTNKACDVVRDALKEKYPDRTVTNVSTFSSYFKMKSYSRKNH
jgi:type I site-specific restriction endonuclease